MGQIFPERAEAKDIVTQMQSEHKMARLDFQAINMSYIEAKKRLKKTIRSASTLQDQLDSRKRWLNKCQR